MLKKNVRDVRLLKITLTKKRKHSREEARNFFDDVRGHSALEECLQQLQQRQMDGQAHLDYLRSRGIVRRAIRCFSFRDDNMVTILWGVGDKDTASPSIWHDTTDKVRTVAVTEDERVACTGHLVLSLQPITQLGGYVACMEEVPQLGPASLEGTLRYLFNKYVSIREEDTSDPTLEYDLVIGVKVDPLASRDFEEAMKGRQPLAIVAETVDDTKTFDENFARTERELCTLKAKKGTRFTQFMDALNALRGERRKYKRYTIKYKEGKDVQRSIAVSESDLARYDLETFLFSQRERIHLKNEIAQFCDEIHTELERKMRNLLLAEQQRLCCKELSTPSQG